MTLEELLNTLIQRGWKPRGYEGVAFYIENKVINWLGGGKTTFRELVSKESGLRQYVCENKMIPYDEDGYTWYERTKDYIDDFENSGKMLDLQIDNGYEYRLIESSLKDESELEDFLLQNIKVGNED